MSIDDLTVHVDEAKFDRIIGMDASPLLKLFDLYRDEFTDRTIQDEPFLDLECNDKGNYSISIERKRADADGGIPAYTYHSVGLGIIKDDDKSNPMISYDVVGQRVDIKRVYITSEGDSFIWVHNKQTDRANHARFGVKAREYAEAAAQQILFSIAAYFRAKEERFEEVSGRFDRLMGIKRQPSRSEE